MEICVVGVGLVDSVAEAVLFGDQVNQGEELVEQRSLKSHYPQSVCPPSHRTDHYLHLHSEIGWIHWGKKGHKLH